ncbi:MAG TPA: hypothetical protein VGF56_05720 [Rhizomicrobium sp.]|jgi:hypothetical protein
MTLAQFLSRAAAKPFAFGSFDCLLFPADCVRDRLGVDPAAEWRGTYDSALGCERILRREGGVVAIMHKALAPLGVMRTQAPKPGDVGAVLVATKGGNRVVGGVKTAHGWAMLGARGLLVLATDFTAAWGL